MANDEMALTTDWRAVREPMCWRLERRITRKPKDGGAKYVAWQAEGYYAKPEQLLSALVNKCLLASDVTTLESAIDAITALKADITETVAPAMRAFETRLFTPPPDKEVPHVRAQGARPRGGNAHGRR